MRLYFPTQRTAQVISSRMLLKKLGMFAFFISLSNNVSATTNFNPESCNTSFLGVVKTITDSRAPFSSLPQETITFKVSQVKKGNTGDEYSLTVLKGGPHQFKVGEKFEVYAQDGLACSFKDVESESDHSH